MEPVEFLRSQPPFDRLTPGEFAVAERSLEIAYVPRGEAVLRRGGARAEHLHVVRKGAIRLERDGQLVQVLEEGDAFGFPSLIGRASPHVDAVAAEDTLLYRLSAAAFDELMKAHAFAEWFASDLAARLRAAATPEVLPLQADLALPAARLVRREPARIARTATVGEAAARMRDLGVSSLLVDGEPAGIVTDRDLRSRVLAEGRGADTPLAAVMTAPVLTLDASASLFEVLLFMLERRVHHVPLEQDGRVTGVVTDTDLLRAQASNPLHVLGRVTRGAAGAGYADELARVVESLHAAGLEAVQIGRVVARLNDALVARLLAEGEAELGPPPAPYAWLVLGSEGRLEQALLTDQDNALVFGDAGPDAARYFGALAERTVAGLLAAGFPSCPGGYMATRWCRPLSAWVATVREWIETPEPRAVLDAALFADWRAAHGTLDLAPFAAAWERAATAPRFLAHLARAAVAFEPPIGAFHQIRSEHGGVDLKKGGLQPIVALARVLALEARAAARPTLARLAAAAAAGGLSREGAADLAEAFRFVQRLRLRDLLQARREGRAPGAVTPLESLSALERAHLKSVFVAVREVQAAMRLRFGTERMP